MIHVALWIASALFLGFIGLLLFGGGLVALGKIFEALQPRDPEREAKIRAFEERAKEVYRTQLKQQEEQEQLARLERIRAFEEKCRAAAEEHGGAERCPYHGRLWADGPHVT